MRRLIATAVLGATVTLTAMLPAQVRMGGGFVRAPSFGQPFVGFRGGASSVSIGSLRSPFNHRFPSQTIFLGDPWFADYPEPLTGETPQVILLQQTAPPPPMEEPQVVTPLLIELQGDRYVRSGGFEIGRDRRAAVNPDQAGTTFPGKSAVTPGTSELPTILVFRDQHREEVESYAIVGGTIYVNSNYWSSGAWTRKVLLADLDLPSTFSLNRQRGVKFTLPAGPNEVVTRP